MCLARDQIGRNVEIISQPRRIISLCPSVTETLFALGLRGRIVGRTDYCCHPDDAVAEVAPVGGTKNVRIGAVDALRPDLIVAVREENREEAVRELASRWPVLVLDPESVCAAVDSVQLLGEVTGTSPAATKLAAQISRAFDELPRARGIRVAYLIWRRPYMAAGGSTYIDDVLDHLGLVNVVRSLDGRYPEVEGPVLAGLRPRFLLASSEPFPFTEQHVGELRQLVPGAEPVLVDGQMFGWHGVRMLAAASYFKQLIPRLLGIAAQAGP